MNRTKQWRDRRGNILVLTAFSMIGMMAMLAFSVDLGVTMVARQELQRTADAAALAACWELVDPDPISGTETAVLESNAQQTARNFAGFNHVLTRSPELADEDVEVGYIADPTDPQSPFLTGTPYPPNAVRVAVRRSAEHNGVVPAFFARAFGVDGMTSRAEATAAFLYNLGGFRSPPEGQGNAMILPFALDQGTWNAMLESNDSDRMVNLFPQDTGAPGNRGTVNIGTYNNSTSNVRRQIREGLNQDDLDWHGGSLELDENGQLMLTGNPGISAAVKSDLVDLMHSQEPRIIFLFSEVEGQGNQTTYTIVSYVGVRIVDVKLTGKMSSKRVMVEPARVIARGGIPAKEENQSYFLYSPVWLAR